MKFNFWIDKRKLLNHDILQNQVLNELTTLKMSPTDSNMAWRLKQWVVRKEEYQKFIKESIEALSPVQLLNTEIFDSWSPYMKEQFAELFREIFLAKSRLDWKVRELIEKLDEAEAAAISFISISYRKRTLAMVEQLEKLLGEFSRLISMLPNHILY